MNEFKIGNDWVGINHRVYFIADIAANHDGDLKRAKALIKLAKEAGANAAKFQHHNVKKYVSDYQGAEQIYLFLISKDVRNYIHEGNLADLYANYLNNYEKAAEHYWSAVEKTNLNAQMRLAYFRNLADIYADKLIDKRQEFEEKAQDALEIDFKDSVDFLTMLAKYYKDTDQVEKSMEYLEQALILNPDNRAIKDEIERLKK